MSAGTPASRQESIRQRILQVVASGGTAPADLGKALPDVAAASVRKAVRTLHAEHVVRVNAQGHLAIMRSLRRPKHPAHVALDNIEASPAAQDGAAQKSPALEAVLAVLSEGGLWRVGDLRERTGFGSPGILRALAGLQAEGDAVLVARGHWRSASIDCNLARDGRTLTVRLLGCLMDGQVRKISDLPHGNSSTHTLHETIKRMRDSGLLTGPRRGYVACCPGVTAELSRRLAIALPGHARGAAGRVIRGRS